MGGSIREARRRARISQEELGRRSTCSTVYIRLIESGYEPNVSEVIPRIWEALGRAHPSNTLLAHRMLAGLSPDRIAALSSMTVARYEAIEAGDTKPTRDQAEAIACALGVAVSMVFPPHDEFDTDSTFARPETRSIV